ncbi:hypothetical protein C8Q80DRAFT_1115800 [Daedaleopsis nitida]|nr:hypothetical protein C8Q80DRAFT_1115800 [Daedaleopsis nitida]
MIQCAISEWSTGIWANIPFREKTHKRFYLKHLKDLEKFRNDSINITGSDILHDICTTISHEGCGAASAPEVEHLAQTSISDAALSNAIMAYASKKRGTTGGGDSNTVPAAV